MSEREQRSSGSGNQPINEGLSIPERIELLKILETKREYVECYAVRKQKKQDIPTNQSPMVESRTRRFVAGTSAVIFAVATVAGSLWVSSPPIPENSSALHSISDATPPTQLNRSVPPSLNISPVQYSRPTPEVYWKPRR